MVRGGGGHHLLFLQCNGKELTFTCPCIANIIPNYSQQDATFVYLFISTDALHVSVGCSVHHQEHKTVHTASGIQIRLVVGKFVLAVFKFVCRLRLIALDSTVGNCC